MKHSFTRKISSFYMNQNYRAISTFSPHLCVVFL